MDKRAYPLRRIVGHAPHPTQPWVTMEVLECGHHGHALAAHTTVALHCSGAQVVPVEKRRCFRCSLKATVPCGG